MKIYTIGTTKRECHGHGDFSDDASIQILGGYNSQGFPPCFIHKCDAEEYLHKNPTIYNPSIVELNLIGGGLV